MKIDIILAGVGGQGILSIAAVIGEAALSQGLFMKQSEVHGMSQRGGDVQSNLRISDSNNNLLFIHLSFYKRQK
jgi:indolepyruvate ferredoxin oxidoreductase beta subunit